MVGTRAGERLRLANEIASYDNNLPTHEKARVEPRAEQKVDQYVEVQIEADPYQGLAQQLL